MNPMHDLPYQPALDRKGRTWRCMLITACFVGGTFASTELLAVWRDLAKGMPLQEYGVDRWTYAPIGLLFFAALGSLFFCTLFLRTRRLHAVQSPLGLAFSLGLLSGMCMAWDFRSSLDPYLGAPSAMWINRTLFVVGALYLPYAGGSWVAARMNRS
jgi:hypothetical protein